MFCDKCGSIGIPSKKGMVCLNCNSVVKIAAKRSGVRTTDVQGPNLNVPEFKGTMEHNCKRCGHGQAFFAEIPPRYGDEFSTFLLKCGECGFVAREELGAT